VYGHRNIEVAFSCLLLCFFSAERGARKGGGALGGPPRIANGDAGTTFSSTGSGGLGGGIAPLVVSGCREFFSCAIFYLPSDHFSRLWGSRKFRRCHLNNFPKGFAQNWAEKPLLFAGMALCFFVL